MSKLRFAIVGCGVIHGTHVDTIRKLADEAELVAVCDEVEETAKRVAEKNGVAAFSDLDTMLREADFDVLSVCTPSGLHARNGIAGAKAGKHIVCEKPIDVSLKAADALIAACRENNVTLEVISQHRYAPGMKELRRWVDEGKLGRLVYGEAVTKWFRTQEYYDSGGWRGTWALDGGGALMNQGVHFVDQLRWIMGPVKSVSATMGTLAHERIEVEDVVSATIEFESGAVGTLMASTALYPGYEQALQVYGLNGTVMVENNKVKHAQFSSGTEERTPGGFRNGATPPLVRNYERAEVAEAPVAATAGQGSSDPRAISGSGHVAHYLDLIDSIRTGRQPFMNGQEARNALELIVGVYQSARTGKRVYFPVVED